MAYPCLPAVPRLRPLTRLGLLIGAAGILAGCQELPTEQAAAPAEPIRATAAALTAGAGSTEACSGNPARCAMVLLGAGLQHSAAIRADGTVWTWGSNSYGQLGFTPSGGGTYQPERVGDLTQGLAVIGGLTHTLAIIDGRVMGWGGNDNGELGDSTLGNMVTTPMEIKAAGAALGPIAAIAAGDHHSLALTKVNGNIYAWGSNGHGQLGRSAADPTPTPAPTPALVWGETELKNVKAISAGGSHSLALAVNGDVRFWGLYKATGLQSDVATIVSGVSNVVTIASGSDHSLALRADGTIWAWGAGSNHQLGNGEMSSAVTPVQVLNADKDPLMNVVAIAAAGDHSLALDNDGNVWQWGYIPKDGLEGWQAQYATKVVGLSGIVAIAAGAQHSLAADRHGRLWAWGKNDAGQLGVLPGSTFVEEPAFISTLKLTEPCEDLGSCTGTVCGGAVSLNCASYTCDVDGVACRETCTTATESTDCAGGFVCNAGGECALPTGSGGAGGGGGESGSTTSTSTTGGGGGESGSTSTTTTSSTSTTGGGGGGGESGSTTSTSTTGAGGSGASTAGAGGGLIDDGGFDRETPSCACRVGGPSSSTSGGAPLLAGLGLVGLALMRRRKARRRSGVFGALGLVLAVGAIGATPATAHAQTADELRAGARAIAMEGIRAYEQQQWTKSIELLEKAEVMLHAPTHVLYLARSYAAAGRLVKARETYLKLVNEPLSPTASGVFRDAQRDGNQELALLEKRVPSVRVLIQGASSEVTATQDGAPFPSVLIGVPRPLDPGKYTFRATAPGLASEAVSVELTEGQRQVVTLVLEPSPESVVDAATGQDADGTQVTIRRNEEPGSTPAVADKSKTPTSATPPANPSPTQPSSALKIGGYVSLGVGVLGLGAGTAFALVSHGKRVDGDDLCPAGRCQSRDKSTLDSLDSQASLMGQLSVAGFAVGAAGVATGVVLLILGRDTSNPDQTAAISPWIGYGAAGLSGKF